MAVNANALETLARPAAFLLVFVAMALWEILAPKRSQATRRSSRWPSNLGIVALNSLLVRAVFPLTAVAWARTVAQQGFGLLNIVAMPSWLAAIAAFVLLDLAIYLQHRLFHAVPMFWRLHRMHHADTEIDVTNGLRFHPIEIVLNATSIFNHANVRLTGPVDRSLRLLVVTPDMHRVHHSVLTPETNSNFGFNLPWWDRWFGTYQAQPRDGHADMRIGLPHFRDPKWLRLDRMLVQPWVKPDSDKI